MWKLIVGILLILGTINSLVNGLQKFDTSVTEEYYVRQGYVGGQMVIITFAIWLIYSWAKSRKKKSK